MQCNYRGFFPKLFEKKQIPQNSLSGTSPTMMNVIQVVLFIFTRYLFLFVSLKTLNFINEGTYWFIFTMSLQLLLFESTERNRLPLINIANSITILLCNHLVLV